MPKVGLFKKKKTICNLIIAEVKSFQKIKL